MCPYLCVVIYLIFLVCEGGTKSVEHIAKMVNFLFSFFTVIKYAENRTLWVLAKIFCMYPFDHLFGRPFKWTLPVLTQISNTFVFWNIYIISSICMHEIAKQMINPSAYITLIYIISVPVFDAVLPAFHFCLEKQDLVPVGITLSTRGY